MKLAILTMTLAVPGVAAAQGRFSVELFLGVAHNFGTTLTIEQGSGPPLEIDARYATRPFELPPYYAGRFGVHDDSGAWEIQLTHHKLYLENAPPEVQSFEISHGFNVLAFGRSITTLPVVVRVLGGVVIAHPDSEVRGEPFSPGYQLTGPAFVAGAAKTFAMTPWLFISLDAQFLVARANVPVSRGEARAASVSIHGLFGLGVRF